ncbi:MAG TPA: hypothetical protein VF741_09375 [Candidatus Aquilonibacter sp.]
MPTAPSSPGPSIASAQTTYSSANPTITLPTVGMIASQVTLPPGLVPDGTALTISVSSGSSTAQAVRVKTVRRAATIAGSAWTATVATGTSVSFDPSQISVVLAVGGTTSSGGTVTFYAANGSNLTDLGTVGVDPASSGTTFIFDGTSPCATSETNNTNGDTTSGVTISYNIGQAQATSRVRTAQTGGGCAFAAAAAPALATGDLYVSDPGQSAVLLFPADASGNVQPYSPLSAAPRIATDFAGELISASYTPTGLVHQPLAEIRPYGSATMIDAITAANFEITSASLAWVAADPIGAHIGLDGGDLSASTCTAKTGGGANGKAATCPLAIELFDRTQGGGVAPAIEISDLNVTELFGGLTLDQNDDAFLGARGALPSGAIQCGAYEYVPNFGVLGGTTGPFAVFPNPTSQCTGIEQIAVDAAGNVYVAYFGAGVYVYAPGTTVPGWTLPSSVLPNSNGPEGVAVDASGDVYLSSPQIVSSDGSTVLTPAAVLVFPPIASWAGAATTPLRTITGAATGLVSPGRLAVINTSPSSPPSSAIVLNPTTVSFTATGQSQNVGVSETGYSGSFAETDTCSGIATIASASGGFSVTAGNAGTCFATIADANGNNAKLGVTVTTTSFSVSSRKRP